MTNDANGSDSFSQPRNPGEVLDLAWAHCEGTLSEADNARLEVLLTDAANRADYTQYMLMVADLEWERSNATAFARHGSAATAQASLLDKLGSFVSSVGDVTAVSGSD